MIATDKFLFVHLHKSGGTFVNQYLLRHAAGARRIGYHLPYWMAPDELRRLPVLGMLRCPLAYYLSWFHFQRAMHRPNSLFLICSNGGVLGFEETVQNLANIASDDLRLRQLESSVPAEFVRNGLNITKRCVGELRGFNGGFYSFLCARMYSGAERLHLIETSKIRTHLPRWLEMIGDPPDPEGIKFLQTAPDLNTSNHESVEQSYSSRLKNDVLGLDALAGELLDKTRRGTMWIKISRSGSA